jgi:thiamine pyrophosphate-dependent acetolactate synthase large subunit-like protein/nitrite reductase/ring-hydroxylating ferredoxin subunit
MGTQKLNWYRVADPAELPEGRVKVVTAAHKSLALTHHEGKFCALDNACPHQGGPLGEGSIENGWLRCPWHGWDYHPCTGKPPGGFDDGVATFPVEEREDGIYVGLEEEAAHQRTVSDLMTETMVRGGIKHVFGMVGHSNLGLADAIRRQEAAGNLTYIGIRHEGAGAFAASAYGKLTGRPAACLSIAGPGATNMLTGLWDAKVDRVPVLALTGQVDTQVLGPGAFQEVDLASAYSAVAAWSQTVLHGSKHAELVTLAIKHALLKRDVAHLIFPDEVQVLPAAESAQPSDLEGRLTPLDIAPPSESVDSAAKLLRGSKRPVIIVGHGARFQMDAITAFAESNNIPVVTTFKGKGLIPDDHRLACGVLGRSGTPIASWFMNEADLLLVMGASFSSHTGITPKKPIIQIDYDPLALGKFHPVTVPVWGEIAVTLQILDETLGGAMETIDQCPEIEERWAIWRKEKARRELDDRGKGVNSAAVFAAMNRQIPADAVIAVDVGNNTYSFGRYFECQRQSVLMSGYLGSIGFGYPAAIGAWAACPDRPIVAVTGDGGFGQYMGELLTAVKYGMNITHVLLNNDELGKISKEQRAGHWDVWQTSLHNPDFARYAEICGALGIRVTRADELDGALEKGLSYDGPALIEIVTDAELV